MLFNPWNGALTTINYGNDLSRSRKVEDGITLNKLSNFTSQNPITIISRSILEIYPDYLFPYDLVGYKERFTDDSVKKWGDLPFRHREYGSAELAGLGMYNRLPKPNDTANKYSSKIGYWDLNDDDPKKQVSVQYSPFYKKPFNIDTKVEDNVKTLDGLKSLSEREAPSGDGIDFIDFGSEQPMAHLGQKVKDDFTKDSEYSYGKYDIVPIVEVLIKRGLLTGDERGPITGIRSDYDSDWDDINAIFQQIHDKIGINYLAGPNDQDNKLRWFVTVTGLPKVAGYATTFGNNGNQVLATSNEISFSDLKTKMVNKFSTTTGDKRILYDTVSLRKDGKKFDNIEIGGFGSLRFYILGGIIKPKIENGEITETLKISVPKQDFFTDDEDYTEKIINKGPARGTILEKLGEDFGLVNVGNQLNAGNSLVESPFWRHNFPTPGLNSNIGKTNDTDNNTVYYTYWGGKYFLYNNKNSVGTHLPIGVRVDLDSWDNTSELIKGDQNTYYKGRVNMLTQHNKDQFSLEYIKNTSSYFGDTNHVYKSNYNRSKNWKGSLAYLWLANHYHRPWTGTYTNSSRFYGPLQTLGLASIVASIPKATLLLLGAVLWRMRESGLLISEKGRWNLSPSENAIKDVNGDYLDPINIPILPKEIKGIISGTTFNTEYFGWENYSEVKNDKENGTYIWNNGVRPPMASLLGFGEFYQTVDDSYQRVVNSGAIVSCFPRADEWPTPNLGMTYVDDYFGRNGLVNPFKNQYKIWTPFFQQMGALMQRFPNQSVIWFTRKEQLKEFDKKIEEALNYLQKYSENYEYTAAEEIDKEGKKKIEESSKNVRSIEEAVGTLESFLEDNDKLSGADESYSKFTIIQHDLNRLHSKEYRDEKGIGDYGRSVYNKVENQTSNLAFVERSDYLRGYIPIGPELWFLPTSVKNIIIDLFLDYVGDFNNFQGDADSKTGSDFDKVLAIIDPLNFPNPKDEVGKKEYQSVLKGDMTPYRLKSISEDENYKLPFIDSDSTEKPKYPKALKRWEETYTNFEGKTPRPPLPSILSQKPGKNTQAKQIPETKSDANIDIKSFFPTAFYIPKPAEDTNTFDTLYSKEIKSEYVVANSTPRIWWGEYAVDSSKEETQQEYFYFNQSEIDKYIEGISNILSTTKVENLTKKLFKSGLSSALNNQDNDIKLSLYRSLQSIYNKWISASSNSGEQKRLFYNPIGSGIDDDRLLIDHFSFVNRINADIGNEAVINLETTLTIKNNIQNSIFGITSDILDTSNFAFHPLPAYVDLSTGITDFSKKQNEEKGGLRENIIRNMFIPQTSSESFSYASGPHYLCMYVGGNSKVLDFGKNIESDSCLKLNGEKLEKRGDSGSLMETIGSDSNGDPTKDKTSPGVVGFKVKFADQNQNHFIGVELDQAEYKNTNESLRAIEMISQAGQPGAAGGLVFKGQSLYEVFLNRSYSCTVEAFGNMMIQPLQYFELENVPMFYGSYLIRDVKHSIKPHSVKTSFTGDRIPQTTTPLVEDVIALYEIQRGEGEPTSLGGGSNFIGTTSKFNPKEYTEIENSLIEVTPIGTVTTNPPNAQTITKLWRLPSGGQTIPNKDAAIAVIAMVEAAAKDGITLTISSGFRPATGTGDDLKWIDANGKTGTFTTQETLRRDESRFIKTTKDYIKFIDGGGSEDRPNYYGLKEGKEAFIFYASSESYNASTAPIGKSEHGSGIAVDFNTGGRINFTPLRSDNYVWMAKNSYKYGFIRTVSSEEWHFEYRPEEAVNGPYAKVKPGSGGKLENNGWYADLGLDNLTVQTDAVGTDSESNEQFDTKWKDITIEGSDFPDKPIKTDLNIKLTSEMVSEYLPALEKAMGSEPKGFKLLVTIMAQKEGFYDGTRSYKTNNPGNIGNTDEGRNRSNSTLEDGILLQKTFIQDLINDKNKSFPVNREKVIKPYFSKEIAKNVKNYGMSPYLPGYKFTYNGQLDQFIKIYSTGARGGNSYLSMIISYFKSNGIDINEKSKIQDIINFT